jgi:hypothetical protein
VPVFAGNPAVVRGENGEWIMIFEHSWPPPCDFSVCTCDNGTTTAQCNAAQAAKDCNYNTARWPSYMAYATDPNGPWSTPEMIPAFRDEGGQVRGERREGREERGEGRRRHRGEKRNTRGRSEEERIEEREKKIFGHR